MMHIGLKSWTVAESESENYRVLIRPPTLLHIALGEIPFHSSLLILTLHTFRSSLTQLNPEGFNKNSNYNLLTC